MTRPLNHKAAAALLKTAFADRGAPVTHTEALDLVAKLEGFNAWSHLKQVTKTAAHLARKQDTARAPMAMPTPPVVRDGGLLALQDVLAEHYGPTGDVPGYPLANCPDETDYYAWAAEMLMENLDVIGDFKPEGPVPVVLPSGQASTWRIEQNLTDRWGELNDFNELSKPGLALLTVDSALLDTLRAHMCGEDTFIVRKDGQFGILMELEFCTKESETPHAPEGDNTEWWPEDKMLEAARAHIKKLQPKYPGVELCVPPTDEICNERVGIWAFAKPGSISEEDFATLAHELYMM